MGSTTAQKSTASATGASREVVPVEVYEGVDFDALNAKVTEYRELTREHGFEAALSHYAGEPVAVRSERGV